jgi:hypothetical protein
MTLINRMFTLALSSEGQVKHPIAHQITPHLSFFPLHGLYTFWIFYHQEYFKISVLEDSMKFLVAEKTSKGLALWFPSEWVPMPPLTPRLVSGVI